MFESIRPWGSRVFTRLADYWGWVCGGDDDYARITVECHRLPTDREQPPRVNLWIAFHLESNRVIVLPHEAPWPDGTVIAYPVLV